jgi:hypothetical protein
MDVLLASSVTNTPSGWWLTLPNQLDRKLYVEVNKVLEAAGGKWNRGAKVHVFASDPRKFLFTTTKTGMAPKALNHQQVTQAFYTPPNLAYALVQHLVNERDFDITSTILEPSAGGGALLDVIAEYTTNAPRWIEKDEAAFNSNPHKDAGMGVHADFLTWATETSERFTHVCMNPPFTKGADAIHIAAAARLLVPGGVLVAICTPNMARDIDREPYASAQAALHRLCTVEVVEEVSAGAFKDTGTMVATIVIRAIRRMPVQVKKTVPLTSAVR